MKSKPFSHSVELAWSYGTQQNIGMGVISNLKMALPGLREQEEISGFLKSNTEQLDKMIAKTTVAIEKLQEHRTALITAAVTGKIDVREEAA